MAVVKNKKNEVEKNIPIEIVLQDPNDPIVPTPGPSDPTGGETGTAETNIAVPNTGTDTNSTNGSNGIFANLYLDGGTTSEYYFAPTENAGL